MGEERVPVRPQRAELARGQPLRLEPVRIRRHVDGGRETWMRDRAVVALEEVLAGDLPVRLELELRSEPELERVDVDDLGEPRRDVAEHLGQRGRVRVGIDEDEWPRGVDRDLLEAELGEVEARLAIGPRSGAQGAVEPVRPRVVRALERLARAGPARDDVAAMATDVEEGANVSLARACNNYGNLAGDGGEVGAVLRELALVADVLPGARKDALVLTAQHGRVAVPGPGQRPFHAANYAWTVSVSASTTTGSKSVPEQRRSSAIASATGIALRYARSVVIALKASQQRTMRATSGISSPRRPSG